MRRFVLNLSVSGLALALGGAALHASPAAAQPANTCVFTMTMEDGTDVNNLDFVVNYLGTGGNVEGTPTNPECARALPGQSFASFHDNDGQSTLNVSVIRLNYFSGPVDLAACRIFYDSTIPEPADFSVQVTNAGRDGGDNNVEPTPDIEVTKVECPGELPELTTTTTEPEPTTTTLPTGDRCGFPVSNGEKPAASDALFALKAAVGGGECALCVCDVNDSGNVAASDALTILRAAVGVETELDCPAC